MNETTHKILLPLETPILIVDDSPAMLTEMTKILDSEGLKKIYTATNGIEAWNLLLQEKDHLSAIQLILCDWNMPRISGIQLLEKVRQSPIFKNLPFILVTTENTTDRVRDAIKQGVSNYIVKPYSKNDVVDKLNFTWSKVKKDSKTP
jgi:two-component system chemotaxis response regulator CheY